MKKTRFIALVLVAAVMMMGAGYAWWNEEIVVNSTIDTGELSVQLNSAMNSSWAVGEDAARDKSFLATPKIDRSKVNGTKTINLAFDDLYPIESNTYSAMSVNIVNNGTLDAEFNNAVVNLHNTSDLMKKNIEVYFNLTNEKGKSVGGSTATLATLEEKLNEHLKEDEIPMNKTYQLKIGYRLDKNAPNECENSTARASITFDWEQFNALGNDI